MSKISSSFVTGAIALVFAVLGYQTALLVHYAATAKIAANRDTPDTVFVYQAYGTGDADGVGYGSGASYQSSGSRAVVAGEPSNAEYSRSVKVEGRHTELARQIRRSTPGRKAESFRFNPNTVSVEDLIRLGFSPKQAQSIENYRNKGGKFRRKSDFAKSYVVSDSLYRRLERFIDIPLLDLNKADSAAFDSLPGIGGYFAGKMVSYRNSLGGYSCKEQLMEIYHFDREKFDALKDLVTIGTPYRLPLWTMPEDSLVSHPYISKSQARSIYFFRSKNPESEWSVDNLFNAGLIDDETRIKLKRCVEF